MRPSRDLVLAWALLLPALLFATPVLLAGDPYPHLSGAGWTAFAALPLGVLLFAGPGRPGWIAVALAGLAAFAGGQLLLRDLPDPFEARRAVLAWITASLAFGGGSCLGPRGRALFGQGLVLLSLAWSLVALLDPTHAGALQNSGATSQAALPGAVLGAWFASARRGLFGWIGGAAALAFVAHAVLTPVLAGILAFVIGIAALFLAAEVRSRTGRVRTLGLFLALPIAGLLLARALPSGTASELVAPSAEAAPSDFDGAGVRARVWTSLLAASTDRPLSGFGPGQFQALYPPYRDAREIELSRHGVCLGGLTEVEHAHSEPLQVVSELGLVAGLVFLVLLGALGFAALGGIRSEREGTRGLGAASIAVLVAAFLHGSWSFVPVSAFLAFALFGALVGPSKHPRLGRVALRALVVALVLVMPFAFVQVRHGLRFRAVVAAGPDREVERAALERVLEVAPDSHAARVALARLTTAPNDPTPWTQLLEIRPHSVELHERVGLALLRAGDPLGAEHAWDRALELSPTQPSLLRNRVRLGWEHGDAARADELFARLRAAGCVDDDWMRDRAVDLLLRGRLEAGLSVLALLEPERNVRVPELLFENAALATDAGAPRTGEAYRAAAHLLWAREKALEQFFPGAVNSYAQALAATRASGAPALPVVLEMACAKWRADRPDEARRDMAGLKVDARSIADLPAWAREVWANELGRTR